MTVFTMKLPDVGEGVAEAEIVDWHVEVGDEVSTESVLAEVLTDKATIEVSAPVAGVVTARHGEPGDVVAVGGPFVEIEIDSSVAADDATPPPPPPSEIDDAEVVEDTTAAEGTRAIEEAAEDPPGVRRPAARRPLASPAVRARAASLGIDLAAVAGTGPDGRVVHIDLDTLLADAGGTRPVPTPGRAIGAGDDGARTEAVRGVRRKIAERLSAAWAEIPHITYVDAVDVTELERLRTALNSRDALRLTLLPFVARALVHAVAEQPRLNAHYDHQAETLTTFDAVHVGVATQTDDGLLVPVIRHAEVRGVRALAAELARVTAAARGGSATRAELSGSTITITSLGALGGLVTTPILNAPEVAIVGVNKIETRPVWRGSAFEPRQLCNLSCSFDHRMVDGWDAAVFVQRLKTLLETPALLFIDE